MGRTIGNDTFLETLKKVSRIAANAGEQVISRDKSTYEQSKRSYTNNIKKDAVAYSQSVKALKEVEGIRKLIPGGKSALLEMAATQAKSTVDKVEGLKDMLRETNVQLKEVVENEKDIAEARKEADNELSEIKKLLKSGFIESIRHDTGVGIFWVYPPMIYKDEGKTIFLGRPEAGITESGTGFSVKLPSYTPDGSIGTAHMRHKADGQDYCFGGYEDIVKVLAAKHQISSLIRMFKEYFQSCNPKSRQNTPNYLAMDINLPKVTDDSWEVWKKSNKTFKMPAPIEVEEETCGDCEHPMDECTCEAD